MQNNTYELPDITKKNVQRPQHNAQAHGQKLLQQQKRHKRQKRPVRIPSGDKQKKQKDSEDDREIDRAGKKQNNGKRNSWKIAFFQQIGLFDKNIGASAQQFREKTPWQKTGTQKNTKAHIIVYTGQPRPHNFGKDHGVDKYHCNGVKNRPGAPKQRAQITGMKFPPYHAENKAPVTPQGEKPTAKPFPEFLFH
ncbi:MAG: hypothetical protein QF876_08440 [Desulfobacterales bacterium]|nr:hypothetical protein [Desulfobacterales bacterium]MDP6806663.1 hypothetical protein [Desulfobacterales bacterium]